MGTQGDGNHFAFVGVSEKTGNTMLVTHHGSRGPGALLYKRGMAVAEKWRVKLSEGVLKQNAWIPADTDDGRDYWAALQLIRRWAKANHTCLHESAAEGAGARVESRFWNEHNFVFQDGDLFYHAKGATPVHAPFLPDTNGTQIVPLNMGEPVLLIEGGMTANNLGFAPRGSDRNLSRTAHKRALGDMTDDQAFAAETAHIDARFFCGNIDASEWPSAYKDAAEVIRQMESFGLCRIVDRIMPHGSIMAGDWERDAFWRKRDKATPAVQDVVQGVVQNSGE
jgi:RNA-splicing ligase RtcB